MIIYHLFSFPILFYISQLYLVYQFVTQYLLTRNRHSLTLTLTLSKNNYNQQLDLRDQDKRNHDSYFNTIVYENQNSRQMLLYYSQHEILTFMIVQYLTLYYFYRRYWYEPYYKFLFSRQEYAVLPLHPLNRFEYYYIFSLDQKDINNI